MAAVFSKRCLAEAVFRGLRDTCPFKGLHPHRVVRDAAIGFRGIAQAVGDVCALKCAHNVAVAPGGIGLADAVH